MILTGLDITADEFRAGTGWEIKPEGACKGDVCVPLDQSGGLRSAVHRRSSADGARARRRRRALGDRPGVARRPRAGDRRSTRAPAARSRRQRVRAVLAPRARRSSSSPGRPTEVAPSTCPGGRRCGPSFTRRASRSSPSGSSSAGAEACRSYIEAAQPEHPSLVDQTHQMAALFGVVNIPNVVWIDEDGMIVRPPEPGWPGPTALPASLLRPRRRGRREARRRIAGGQASARGERGSRRASAGEPHGRPGPRRVPGRDPGLGREGRGERVRALARRGRRAVTTAADVEVGRCRALRAGRSPLA